MGLGRRLTPWLVLAVVSALLVAPAGANPADDDQGDGERPVLVRVTDNADPHALAAEAVEDGGEVHGVFEHATVGFAATLTPRAVERLRGDRRVLAVEADQEVESFVPTGIQRIGADEYEPAGIGQGTSVDADIAVLDTGVDETHPELDVERAVDCRAGTCVDVPVAFDPDGHGTHVAGIAAAADGGEVVGVAPGARLHSVRVLDADGGGSLSAVVAGLDWVADHADEIEVANVSLGCECRSSTLDDAVAGAVEAGVTVIAAAGNAGVDAGTFAPANHPDTLAVAAMSDYDGAPGGEAQQGCIPDPDDSFASYSNYGAVIDLVAPGSCIRSTWPGGGYATSTGTSMAAPHAAGAAALHIVTEGLPPSPERPDEVRRALVDDHAVASTNDCGYTDSRSVAPMLHLTCADIPANHDPTLEITSPDDGLNVVEGETVALRATAEDAEDGDLDDEILWTSSLDGRLGTGGSLDVQLSEQGEHAIVASVTDSSGANVRESRQVTVTDEDGDTQDQMEEEPAAPEEPEPAPPPATDSAPQLTIIAPVPDGRVVAGREAQLVSRAVDREDGDIRPRVSWRSDRDGALGEGGTVGVRLSAGRHRITASVTDSDGNRVERTTSVLAADAGELTSRSIDRACPPDRVPDGGFRDVGSSGPHTPAIDCVAWWDITQGTSGDTYAPDQQITRDQMATFLARTIRESGGSLPSADRDHFADTGDSVHADNINRLAAAGVVRGRTEDSYDPRSPVTRAQMATFLVRTYEYRTSLDLPGIQPRFTDVAGVHAPSINAVAAAGITGGTTPTTYEPASTVRRDQMASFLARTLDVLVQTGTTPARG
jgi:subtilisin family serine protease